jgi:hypothetical protein
MTPPKSVAILRTGHAVGSKDQSFAAYHAILKTGHPNRPSIFRVTSRFPLRRTDFSGRKEPDVAEVARTRQEESATVDS